ncbi:MAG: amidohydrolase family protein [Nitrososphaerales archaeon]
MDKIIDAHIHCSESADDLLIPYAELNNLRYNLQELLSMMEINGVERGLLLSPPVRGNVPLPNVRMVELCKRSKGKLEPILTVEPARGSISAAISLAKREKEFMRGFKIRLGYVRVFASDEIFAPLYDYAEGENLPVMFHTGDTASSSGSLEHSHPLTLDKLANMRENLKIVACHFGNPWIDDVAELTYKHFNMYADISGLFTGMTKYEARYKRELARKISHAIYFSDGADKILFGTDYPVETITSAIAFAKSLSIDKDDLEKIMHLNARKVFGLW